MTLKVLPKFSKTNHLDVILPHNLSGYFLTYYHTFFFQKGMKTQTFNANVPFINITIYCQ